METTEMDAMEEEEPQPNPNSLKRFALKNSIQTNFGDDYVFQIVARDDWTAMAVSLSTNAVKLYSPVTGQYLGECRGHSTTINHISFSGPGNSHILHSCSSDGTIRAWDTRTFNQVLCISAGSSQEVFSFSIGGLGDYLLAAGCKSQILFWDWRNKKQVACLEDSHVDDVTQVHFVPSDKNKLVSASVDGLICTFDTAGDINDDDHLESVINVDTSIGKVGFLGDTYQKLWCLTHIETLSVWDWKEARIEANFQDARSLASDSWTLDRINYFVDCHYSGDDQRLWVIGGTNAGTLGYFPVNYQGMGAIGPPEAVLEGGHTGVVRSVLPMSSKQIGTAQSQGIFGWTGGEDGRLCCWFSDGSPETNRSWISSEFVIKSPRTCKKNRRHPY
ncbi:WD repeat-containing protein GTS1 [Vitis riparia]|uniref:WD repeat-containing protein GTS1 n=1 Tax=Vitis riparia TaxID=96939 RepID=UPI00155AB885|nr:WD repeat-containing protein GTS1 [Vitis riparia]XP_034692387.1 WD repeat-containing protein GTS1 [Vitis riparia]